MRNPRGTIGMVSSVVPTDVELLKASGRVTLAHAQMEYVLCMTVKILSGLSLQEALDATAGMKVYKLRDKIQKLFKEQSPDESVKIILDALLGKAKRLLDKRIKLMHRPWAIDSRGQWVVKEESHAWGLPPSIDELNQLAKDISATAVELNTARLRGFIKVVLSKRRAQ